MGFEVEFPPIGAHPFIFLFMNTSNGDIERMYGKTKFEAGRATIIYVLVFSTLLLLYPLNPNSALAQKPGDSSIITVRTDYGGYGLEPLVVIFGDVMVDAIKPGEQVNIKIFNPESKLYSSELVDINSEGEYIHQVIIEGTLAITGKYLVTASYNGSQAETSFTSSEGEIDYNFLCMPWFCIFILKVGETSYPIYYWMREQVENITLDADRRSLVVTIPPTTIGQFVITLPRNLTQAVDKEGRDINYTIFIDDERVSAIESVGNDKIRTVGTPFFKDGTRKIEFVGTWVIPEFGSSIFVLMIASLAVGLTASRYLRYKSA